MRCVLMWVDGEGEGLMMVGSMQWVLIGWGHQRGADRVGPSYGGWELVGRCEEGVRVECLTPSTCMRLPRHAWSCMHMPACLPPPAGSAPPPSFDPPVRPGQGHAPARPPTSPPAHPPASSHLECLLP